MDEDRRPQRRLLSFDASHVSLARIGKALYSAANPTGTRPEAVGSDLDSCNVSYTARGPVLAMAAYIDRKLAAAAMKGSLEVLNMDGDASVLCGIKLDLRYLPTAVHWGHHHLDSMLALANSGGSLSLYQLTNDELRLREQAATSSLGLGKSINSLSFLSVQPGTQLLGAASDGSVHLWDVRVGIRRPTATFKRPGDIGREVAHRPGADFKFATIYDSGMVQRWDVRMPMVPDSRINAHQQGLSLSWHPHQNYLATGGRDHMLHVWNMSSQAVTTPEYSITTSGPVARARWVPGEDRANQSAIVTCGRDVGSGRGTYVYWHLSSPWLPIHAVERHSGPLTELLPVSKRTVWSAGRDGVIAGTDLSNEPTVASNLPSALVTWSSSNITAQAFRQTSQPSQDRERSPVPPGMGAVHPRPTRNATFTGTTSGSGHGGQALGRSSVHPQLHSWHFNSGPGGNGNRSPDLFAPSMNTTPNAFHNMHRSMSSTLPTERDDYFAMPYSEPPPENPVLEIGMPYEDSKFRRQAAEQLIFDRPDHWSYGDVCRHNAQVMINLLRYRSSQVWNALAIAVDAQQQEFLRILSEKSDRSAVSLAEKWFKGDIPDNYADSAVAEESTGGMVRGTGQITRRQSNMSSMARRRQSSVDEDADFTFSRSPGGPSSLGASLAGSSPRRGPTILRSPSTQWRAAMMGEEVGDPFRRMQSQYWDFVRSQWQPWHLIPMLIQCTRHSLETSLELTTTALLLLFRNFPGFEEALDINCQEVVVSTIRMLQSQTSFVPAAKLLSIVQLNEPMFEQSSPDTVCHRCRRSLSDNAAFLTRDDASVGFWYCSHCKRLLDGCAYCNVPVKGLAIVVLDCGHFQHRECWDAWMQEGIPECPAGCGQAL